MKQNVIHEERLTARWMITTFGLLAAVFLFLFFYQLLSGPVGTIPAPTWFFLLLFFIFFSALSQRGAGDAMLAVLFICAVFACVLIHELSHSLIARRFGKEAKSITLLPIGGVANLEEMPEKPGQEIAMSIVGPFINLAIAI